MSDYQCSSAAVSFEVSCATWCFTCAHILAVTLSRPAGTLLGMFTRAEHGLVDAMRRPAGAVWLVLLHCYCLP